jgi:hypothetical protein
MTMRAKLVKAVDEQLGCTEDIGFPQADEELLETAQK